MHKVLAPALGLGMAAVATPAGAQETGKTCPIAEDVRVRVDGAKIEVPISSFRIDTTPTTVVGRHMVVVDRTLLRLIVIGPDGGRWLVPLLKLRTGPGCTGYLAGRAEAVDPHWTPRRTG